VETLAEYLVEAVLVMIETVSSRFINASDVDDCVECFQKVGVSGSNNLSAGEAFGEAKHEARECFIAVEGSVVCANAR